MQQIQYNFLYFNEFDVQNQKNQNKLELSEKNSTKCDSEEENNYEEIFLQDQNKSSAKKIKNIILTEFDKYKTEMCKNWSQFQYCKYGDKCRFAHGKKQLNSKIPINTLYKTKLCKQYFEKGVCCYGLRCHFTHDVRTIDQIVKNKKISYLQNLNQIQNQQQIYPVIKNNRLQVFINITKN
ncbi:zinc finger protein, putative [Ichthyophthirius multifiliis]|uniref:Zinc finger protein, putative n=1 Tax=Ichthyophthirius multifiliis TaxID=5932 RepID=G0QX13_ICHMU|nr:zinc finger protein, putative [Ichthyophthirius multifiliis]EGR30236.1 zinc finger protein, putative [Ichthyophthirius multifiliis]|eukprot:XP_004031832.1 zinc finger protein, putative [Ichthyophthirius multifiliis]